MKKLVTDNPMDNGMMMLNLVFVNDQEVWVRYGSRDGTDCTLVEFCRRLCAAYGSCNYAEVPFKVGDELGDISDILMDCSGDGCPVGTIYFAMIQAAELRERLRMYEDHDIMPAAPRVLPLDEVMETAGSGWLEEWIEADPEDGTPETHELLQAAWCHGDVVFDSSYTDAEQLKAFYLKPYGLRIWNTRPTEAEMEAAPWTR